MTHERQESPSGNRPGKSYVFISNANTENALAARLATDLKKAGVDVWTASERISAGTDWNREIIRALRDARVLVLIASTNAIGSAFVIEGVFRFLAEHGSTSAVIPIRVEDVVLPLRFRHYLGKAEWLDLRDGYDRVLSRVLETLPIDTQRGKPLEAKAQAAKGYVFLSYAEDDSEFVSELAGFLGQRGYAFWDYARSDRDFDSQLFEELEGVIKGAAATLSILTPAWGRSRWAVQEYLYSKEVRTPTLLLRVRETDPILVIAGSHYIDFVSSKERGFQRLERELKKRGL